MLFLMFAACLVDWETYEQRKAELTDNDGDGVSEADGDCDDSRDTVAPTLDERCDGVDNDCDGVVDEADAMDASFWYRDADGDGAGELTESTRACSAPAGFVAQGDDCDDSDAELAPGLSEVPYDGRDNDCSGGDLTDVDGDGVDATAAGGGDCDDSDPSIYPGAPETWENGATDNDCDGTREAVVATYGTDAILGSQEGGQFGRRIAPLGDVNGDGIAEFLVGAVYEDLTSTDNGAVYLVNGVDGDADSDFPRLTTTATSGFLGLGLDGGQDVDGDTIPDLLVAAPGANSSSGTAWLISGADFATVSREADIASLGGPSFSGSSSGDYLGGTAALLGDVDGDGISELALGAPGASPGGLTWAGAVGVWSTDSRADAQLDDADWLLHGWFEAQTLGTSLQSAGDIDGDGYDDFLIGGQGVLAVILPGGLHAPDPEENALMRLVAVETGERCDPFVLGDVDGDGIRDVGCTASESSFYIFTSILSVYTRTTEAPTIQIEIPYGSYTYQMVAIEDIDMDGKDETLLPVMANSSYNIPTISILFGSDVAPGLSISVNDLPLQAKCSLPFSDYGYRALISPDTTGDNKPDIVVSTGGGASSTKESGGVSTIILPQ